MPRAGERLREPRVNEGGRARARDEARHGTPPGSRQAARRTGQQCELRHKDQGRGLLRRAPCRSPSGHARPQAIKVEWRFSGGRMPPALMIPLFASSNRRPRAPPSDRVPMQENTGRPARTCGSGKAGGGEFSTGMSSVNSIASGNKCKSRNVTRKRTRGHSRDPPARRAGAEACTNGSSTRAGRSAARGSRELGIGRALATFHLDRLARAGLLDAGYKRLTDKRGPAPVGRHVFTGARSESSPFRCPSAATSGWRSSSRPRSSASAWTPSPITPTMPRRTSANAWPRTRPGARARSA